MAVPKRKMSRSNTRSRRANWKATPIDLITVDSSAGTVQIPRRYARAVERGLIDPATLPR